MKTWWWGLVPLFAGLGWVMLSESLLRSRQELLYRLEPGFSQCFKKASGEICAVQYRLALANSGVERHDLVEVHWPAAFAGWQVDSSASDLIGSARVTANPLVRPIPGSEPRHEIRGLEPNTLLEFTLRCVDCNRVQVEAARKAAVRIEAHGKIVETEPRTTLFGRALTNAARLAGFLL